MELHVEHVVRHLGRVKDGYVAVEDPEQVYLGAQEGEVFQELVGLRLAGMRTVTLAALRFQSHGLPGVVWARESLASYLSHPPRTSPADPFPAPEGRLVALMPRAHEAIPDFLRGLRAGRSVPSMVLDPRRVELAFDFRAHNPSAVESVKQRSGPLRTYAVRTVEGHVLTGRSSALGTGEEDRFVALADTVQFTARGRVRLPNVILNASFLALWTDVTDEATRLAAAHWVPFLAGEANAESVLGLPSSRARQTGPSRKRTPPPSPRPASPDRPEVSGRA